MLLFNIPPGPVTATKPVVALAGTVALIRVLECTVNAAAVPLKLTIVASDRSLPRIWMGFPDVAGGRQRFHELAETHRQTEDGATAAWTWTVACAAEIGIATKGAIRGRGQTCWREAVSTKKSRKGPPSAPVKLKRV